MYLYATEKNSNEFMLYEGSRKMSMHPFILDKFPCLMLFGSIYWKMNNIKTQGVVTSLKTLYMSNKPATLRSIKLYLK